MFPLNLPNVLTVLRIMLVPVLVVALLGNTPAGDVLAAVVFALASLTDFIDGYLARARGSITTFGKLMDPLADKLLIVAALIALVSLHRLAAWVAMVIITRELAVTVLRLGATQAGVVMAASMFGKVKTCLQIAAILAVIAVHGQPLWVSVLLYLAVLVTVLSGLDYFFGLRRRMQQAQPARPARARLSLRQVERPPAPSHSSSVVWCGRELSRVDLAAQLAEQAMALGEHVVLMDRLQVLLARRDEARAIQFREAGDDARDHLAHAVLDEARTAMGLFDDLDLVGALHQLIDLRGHARLRDLEQRRRVDLGNALLDAADLKRGQPALVVGRHRHALDDALDLLRREPVLSEPLPRTSCNQFLRARARGHSRGRHADHAARAVLEGNCSPVQRVDLLRGDPRHRRGLVLGIARRDRDLCAQCALALAHQLGDLLCERLGAERRLAEDDLADRLVDHLLEARHVRALLLAAEIDEALQAREEQLVADAHNLLDASNANARESHRHTRRTRLDILADALRGRQRRGEPCRLHRSQA